MPEEKREEMLFDPADTTHVHSFKSGVWNIWVDISGCSSAYSTTLLPKVAALAEISRGWSHLKRMVLEVARLEGCIFSLTLWLGLKLCFALIPAISLWYNSQPLKMVELAVETRRVDTDALFRTAIGRVLAPLASKILHDITQGVELRITSRIQRFYGFKAYRATFCLDVPTFNEVKSNSSFEKYWNYRNGNMVWEFIDEVVDVVSYTIRLASTLVVLVDVLKGYPEALFFLAFNTARIAINFLENNSHGDLSRVYAARTTDEDYIHSEGLKAMALSAKYRKDMVVGGLGEALYEAYEKSTMAVGDKVTCIGAAFDGSRAWTKRISQYLQDPFDAFGQVYTCMKVVNGPSSAPFSLATLQLVNYTASSLHWLLDFPNMVEDGTIPFPENELDLSLGVSVEFIHVTFKYSSDKEAVALKDVSFKIEPGQLCVIVGENGSGKSTILNLINRVYDITEGTILINGLDIRTLKLADLRKAIAVLDQNYSIFPLTLAQNIGYGDIKNSADMDKIQHAARLGGASEFIQALPHNWTTYLNRPVRDIIYDNPSSTSAFFRKKVDYSKLYINAEMQRDLSGGQTQQIALSRTFMKPLVSSDNPVGLLLFDEPSASLDPKAEHDLFTRLRDLRGSKTMVFSSHRFGKLTRHADIILYIHKGEVLEVGNHTELLKKNGEYAKLWNLQVQDFL